jgi:hypothetical protein
MLEDGNMINRKREEPVMGKNNEGDTKEREPSAGKGVRQSGDLTETSICPAGDRTILALSREGELNVPCAVCGL